MKIIPCYKNQVLSLPAETVLPELSTATREELAVLIAVLAEPEFEVADLSKKLNITESTLISAVSNWMRRGSLSVVEHTDTFTTSMKKAEKVTAKAEPAHTDSLPAGERPTVRHVTALETTLPHYSSEEMAKYLENNTKFQSLIDSCQMIFGKLLNAAESAILIGLVDHLSLSPEYIMLLFAHSAKMEKKSVRYVEKLALNLFDKGILTYADLLDELSKREDAAKMETVVRGLFGMGRRALIDSEKEMIDRWTNEYKMSEEMIRKAYEITVSKTGNPSFPYMNAVIENWHKAAYSTVQEVVEAEEEYRRDKEAKDASHSSFTTDEFYEAALKRSYENIQKQ